MTCIAAQIIGAKEFWQRKHGSMETWVMLTSKYQMRIHHAFTVSDMYGMWLPWSSWGQCSTSPRWRGRAASHPAAASPPPPAPSSPACNPSTSCTGISKRIKQELEDLVSSLDMTMPLPVLSTEELSHRGRLAGTRQRAQTTLRVQQWLNRR